MANAEVLSLLTRNLNVTRTQSFHLAPRLVDLTRYLGYGVSGIKKGTVAAAGMKMEARANGGGVPGMAFGGATASLQSIGATGNIKPAAATSLTVALRRANVLTKDDYLCATSHGPDARLVAVQPPAYFANPSLDVPNVVGDYKPGGYNARMADKMMNESILTDTRNNCRCSCSLPAEAQFKVDKMERIENKAAFERLQICEALVADRMTSGTSSMLQHESEHPVFDRLHPWLQRLAAKNGLSKASNTVYLLHGTKKSNLSRIAKDGLDSSVSLFRTDGLYGRGLYFTDSSCKAFQYAGSEGCILICRVVLGRIDILKQQCEAKVLPSFGCDSAMAKGGHTKNDQTNTGNLQVHNEFVVFQDSACYPEFVLHCSRTALVDPPRVTL